MWVFAVHPAAEHPCWQGALGISLGKNAAGFSHGVHFTKTSLFYKDLSALPEKERSAVNFDQPEALDTECLQDVLGRLAIRDTLKLPFYDFIIHMRKTETVRFESRPLILIEGNFVSSLSMAR